MIRKLCLLAFVCLAASLGYAQSPVNGTGVSYVTAAPSGACARTFTTQIVVTTGFVYTCQLGTWTALSGTGGGPGLGANNTFTGTNTFTGVDTFTGITNLLKVGANTYNCDVGIAAGTWADLPTCIDALVTAGGGTANFSTVAVAGAISAGGTFTRPLNLGSNGATRARVVLSLGPGVRLGCNLTGATEWQNCVNLADGSGIVSQSLQYGLSGLSQSPTPQILLMSGSHVYDMRAPMDSTGLLTQSNFEYGIQYLIQDSTALVADSVVHEIGLFSGSATWNVTASSIRSVGLLIDNPDKSTFTPSSVTSVSQTLTITMAASTTATPNATRVGASNAFVKIAGCSGGTAATPANAIGTWAVTQLGSGLHTVADAQTVFQVQTSGVVGTGTVTGCTYTVTNSVGTAVFALTTVGNHNNLVFFGANGGGATGARPLVISGNGPVAGGVTSSLSFTATENFENPDPSFPNIEINGNGNTIYTSEPSSIDFAAQIHVEPANNGVNPAPGIKIRDAHSVHFNAIDTAGCASCTTGNVLDINQTVANATCDISVSGDINNTNWPITVNNPLDPARPIIRPGNGGNGQLVPGYMYTGNCLTHSPNPYIGQFNPLDPTRIEIREQFLPNAAAATCRGIYGWANHVSGTGAASTGVNPNAFTNQGRCQLTTGATIASQAGIAIDNGSVNTLFGVTNNNGVPWELLMMLNPGATITAGTIRVRAGFFTAGNTTNIPTSGLYVRFDTDAGIADTNWMLCSDVAGVETCVSLGVAPIASTNAKFYLRSDGKQKIYAQVWNGTAWGAETSLCSSGCTGTATLLSGSTALAPAVQVFNDGAVTYTVDVDRYIFTEWGLGN